MKSMKKLVLVGLVLLASVIVLVGCDTNAGDTPSSTGGTTQQPGSEGTGGDSAKKAEDLTLTISDASGSPTSVTLQDTDSDGYYEIGTADELYAFAAAVNGGKTTINGELTSSIEVNKTVLDEQGNLSKNVNFRPWTPIGNGDTPYTGIFYGADKTISGLSFNDTNADYAGLFGYLAEGGSVQNLGVLDSYFCGGRYVGGVVGSNDGQVTTCYNTGAVSGTSEDRSCNVGGVVGYNDGQVTTCYNTGAVSGTTFDCNVGGVVGSNDGQVTTCYNTGAVSGTSEDSSFNVGGVVGSNTRQVTNCYNTGSVTGEGSVCGGGVVGYNDGGDVTNCYNTGSVTGEGSVCLGGVVGYNDGGDVTNCYNTGSVTGVDYSYYVGGVVGYNFSGEVSNCYYLSGTAEQGVSNDNDNGTAEAMDEFFFASEGMAELLNDNQEDGPWKYINENSAPTLKAFNKG